jgi:hypothetical protein
MRIVTLERVAGIPDGDGYIYEGSGYLLRFGIESAEQLFVEQLPHIVDTLDIDPRQIMSLELLGDGYSGLRQVILCISFEETPPEDWCARIFAAPSALPSNSFPLDDHDVLRKLLIQFLLSAPNVVKARFLKDSTRLMQHEGIRNRSKKYQHKEHVAGFLYRVCFDAGSPPSIAEWRNALLYCSERLRHNFSLERLERVTFTAIPNFEQDYKVEADILFAIKPLAHNARSKLRFRARRNPAARSVQESVSVIGWSEQELKQPEKRALAMFDELDTRERLRLWNRCLSKFFT